MPVRQNTLEKVRIGHHAGKYRKSSIRGAAKTEVVLLGFLIGAFIIAAVGLLGDNLRKLWSASGHCLAGEPDCMPATRVAQDAPNRWTGRAGSLSSASAPGRPARTFARDIGRPPYFADEIPGADEQMKLDPANQGEPSFGWTGYQVVPLEYAPASGELFVRGSGDDHAIHPSDIVQGLLEDCSVMSTAMVAADKPEHKRYLASLFSREPDGRTTIRLYAPRPGHIEPAAQTITDRIPFIRRGENYLYWGVQSDDVAYRASDYLANQGQAVPRIETWPMLLEKAVAQLTGNWDGINHGMWPWVMLQVLTGQETTVFLGRRFIQRHAVLHPDWRGFFAELTHSGSLYWRDDNSTFHAGLDFERLDRMQDAGYLLVTSTVEMALSRPGDLIQRDVLVENHSYAVIDVDLRRREMVLRNPHGWELGEIRVSFDDFRQVFSNVSAARPPRVSGTPPLWPAEPVELGHAVKDAESSASNPDNLGNAASEPTPSAGDLWANNPFL